MPNPWLPAANAAGPPPKITFNWGSTKKAAPPFAPPIALLLTPKQAAAKLGMTVKTLLALVRDGEIEYVNVSKLSAKRKRYKFTTKQLEEYLAKRSVKETPQWPSSKSPILTNTIHSSKGADINTESPLEQKIKKMQKHLTANT